MSTMNKRFVFLLAVIVFCVDSVRGLRCYTCSYDERDKDSNLLCVTNPAKLPGNPIRTCLPHFKYCIIIRIESKQTGQVTSFLRKCEENPVEDADIDSMTVVSHYRSCTTDLCNGGDGLNYIDEGHEVESVAILVPDRDSSASATPLVGLILMCFFLSFGFLT